MKKDRGWREQRLYNKCEHRFGLNLSSEHAPDNLEISQIHSVYKESRLFTAVTCCISLHLRSHWLWRLLSFSTTRGKNGSKWYTIHLKMHPNFRDVKMQKRVHLRTDGMYLFTDLSVPLVCTKNARDYTHCQCLVEYPAQRKLLVNDGAEKWLGDILWGFRRKKNSINWALVIAKHCANSLHVFSFNLHRKPWDQMGQSRLEFTRESNLFLI